MSDPIIPSTAEVRADYIRDHTRNFDPYQVGRSLTSEQEFYSEKFDRWLAAHDEAAADMQREVRTVEWEYGVEDNVAEGGVEEGYETEEGAQRMADYHNGQYKNPKHRSWVVRRTYWEPVTAAETPSPVAEMFPGTRAALDALSIRTPSTPNQQGAEQ